MILDALRWVGNNISTLALAFLLSVVVWVSATLTEDPNEERVFNRPIPLEQIGQDTGLYLSTELPTQVRVTLNAPSSVWTRLNNNPGWIEAWVDLTGLTAGEHVVPVHVRVSEQASPVRVVSVDPETVTAELETLVTEQFPVILNLEGEPALGYRRGQAVISPQLVTVSGPESLVSQVTRVRAVLNIAGARDTRRVNQPVEAVNEDGEVVSGVTLTPRVVSVDVPITLEGGYKNVVVRVVTEGQIAGGYRLTNLAVTPLNVTLFSADPELINDLPGFVETEPVNLTGLNDDVEVRKALVLPEGVSQVGEESVLVQISVAAIDGSMKLTIPIEQQGLPPELSAEISPPLVDVIVSGPLPVLEGLEPASFRAVVDLTGLGEGAYQLQPIVDLSPEEVTIDSVQPETVGITVAPRPTPTPTGLPGTPPAGSTATPGGTPQP